MPEEDGPENHRGVDHAVVTPAVGVVAALVNGVDDHHNGDEDYSQHNQPRHTLPSAGVAGGVGAAGLGVAQAEILVVDLVELFIEGQDRLVAQAAGQGVLQLGDCLVGQDGGEVVSRGHKPVLVPGGDGQNGVPLAQAHVGALEPGELLQVAGGTGGHNGHHAVVAVVPVGVVEGDLLLRLGGQDARVVPNPFFVLGGGQALVQAWAGSRGGRVGCGAF